jgi:Asp-tRNA(Asn)/Glu-tRNA(Gln) amidotransferase A subunit family amidase
VTAVPAFRHGERAWPVGDASVGYLSAMGYTQWFNVLGAPAAVVPVGRSADGLPIGVQIVGAPYMDAHVLDAAAAIERGGGPGRPPMPWAT